MQKRTTGFALVAVLTILLVAIGSTPAVAGSNNFSFTINTSDGDNVYGALSYGANQGGGFYDITGITAWDNGSPLSLLPANTLHMNDNLANPLGQPNGNPPWVTANGFAFEVTSGPDQGEEYAFFFDPNTDQYMGCWSQGNCDLTISKLTISEPSSMLLVVPGVLGVLASVRRKVKV